MHYSEKSVYCRIIWRFDTLNYMVREILYQSDAMDDSTKDFPIIKRGDCQWKTLIGGRCQNLPFPLVPMKRNICGSRQMVPCAFRI